MPAPPAPVPAEEITAPKRRRGRPSKQIQPPDRMEDLFASLRIMQGIQDTKTTGAPSLSTEMPLDQSIHTAKKRTLLKGAAARPTKKVRSSCPECGKHYANNSSWFQKHVQTCVPAKEEAQDKENVPVNTAVISADHSSFALEWRCVCACVCEGAWDCVYVTRSEIKMFGVHENEAWIKYCCSHAQVLNFWDRMKFEPRGVCCSKGWTCNVRATVKTLIFIIRTLIII